MRHLRIQGHDYTVEFASHELWTGASLGRSSLKDARIIVLDSLPPANQAEVLLHEVIHQLADMAQLERLDEQGVSTLSTMLFATLRENPWLAQFLAGTVDNSEEVL